MKIETTISDSVLEEIRNKMNRLGSERFTRNAAKRALRRGALKIKNQAVENAIRFDDEKTPEEIFKNVAIVSASKRVDAKMGGPTVRVGVLGGAKARRTAKEEAALERRRKKTGARSLESLGVLEGKGKDNPGGDTFYWRFLEFGTKRQGAKPFLRDAMMKKKGEALAEVISEMDVQLEKEVKKRGK